MQELEKVSSLLERLGRMAHALQYSAGLNPAQWEALRFFARANRYSASPTALAKYLQTTKGTVSQTLKALETKGYIRRVRGRPDGRSVHIELTEAGKALMAADPLRTLDRACSGLSEAEREAMVRGMSRLVDALCQTRGAQEFGVCADCVHLNGCAAGTDGKMSCVCGLTGEPLRTNEIDRLCVNFDAVS